MKAEMFAAAIAALMFLACPFAAVCADAADDSSFVIVDGTGEEFEFAGPVDHIVTMGYASTLTVAEAGQISKIVAVDKYSTYENSKDERLKDLKAEDLGSIYGASNNDLVMTELVRYVDAGDMSKSDAVILTAYSNAKVLRTMLADKGFTHVLVYLSVTDYAQIVDFVDDMTKIVGGDSGLTEGMLNVRDVIADELGDIDEAAKAKAMFVRFYKDSFTIGNTGSIAVSLIESAGGVNIGYNPDIDKSAYGDKNMVAQLLEDNRDAVVFVDAGYFKGGKAISDFRTEVLGGDKSIKVVPMEANWNNYCPDAAEGLKVFACQLYPDVFGDGSIFDEGEAEESNTLLYVGAAAVVIVIVAVIGIFVMRRQ